MLLHFEEIGDKISNVKNRPKKSDTEPTTLDFIPIYPIYSPKIPFQIYSSNINNKWNVNYE